MSPIIKRIKTTRNPVKMSVMMLYDDYVANLHKKIVTGLKKKLPFFLDDRDAADERDLFASDSNSDSDSDGDHGFNNICSDSDCESDIDSDRMKSTVVFGGWSQLKGASQLLLHDACDDMMAFTAGVGWRHGGVGCCCTCLSHCLWGVPDVGGSENSDRFDTASVHRNDCQTNRMVAATLSASTIRNRFALAVLFCATQTDTRFITVAKATMLIKGKGVTDLSEVRSAS
jgi:hypothetical protein